MRHMYVGNVIMLGWRHDAAPVKSHCKKVGKSDFAGATATYRNVIMVSSVICVLFLAFCSENWILQFGDQSVSI